MTELKCQKCGELLIGRKAGVKYCYVCSDKVTTERANARKRFKKLFILVLVGAIYGSLYLSPVKVRADEQTRKELQNLSRRVKAQDDRREAARLRSERVAKVNGVLAAAKSPMSGLGESFVSASERTGVDYRLLLAITWKESSFGKHIPVGSFNAWGWGIHQGVTFNSWTDGINTVAAGLAKSYNTKDIRATIMRYAPPSENNTELYIAQVEQFIKGI